MSGVTGFSGLDAPGATNNLFARIHSPFPLTHAFESRRVRCVDDAEENTKAQSNKKTSC